MATPRQLAPAHPFTTSRRFPAAARTRTALAAAVALGGLLAGVSPALSAQAATPHARHATHHHHKARHHKTRHHKTPAHKTPAPKSTAPTTGGTTPTDSDASGLLQPRDVFGAASFWRQDIGAAPLASNSAAMVDNLVGQVKKYYGGTAGFNAYKYNVTWFNASANQATTNVQYNDCFHQKWKGKGLMGPGGPFANVPIPANAVVSAGTDQTLTVYQPSTDRLWDFWRAQHDSSGWHACWGGRIDNVSTNPGYFSGGWGAAATGLAGEAGDISITDARTGSIDHAISLAIPSPAKFTRYSWPAQRSDGASTDPDAIPEGTRLRLDPSVDVDSLNLSPIATMIAKAAQKYGFIIANRSGAVAVATESGAPTKNDSGADPWKQLLGKQKPYQVLKGFPWQSLQVLPNNYGK